MRKLLFIVFCFFYTSLLFSQQQGNEWINYNQNYYKFQIYQDGIYRIPYTTILAAGISTSIDPNTFQIFGRGVEQYIFVKGEDDGSFYTSGYIEFYAQKNDGWLDSLLYHEPGSQGNPNYSLFTDTATYYLTWKLLGSPRRLTIESDTSFSGYNPATYFNRILREDYFDKYFNGVTYNMAADPDYIKGEGWFDYGFWKGGQVVKNLATTNVFSLAGAPDAQVDFNLIGASDYSIMDPDHHVHVQLEGIALLDTLYNGYQMFPVHREVTPANLGSVSTAFTFSSIDDLGVFNNPDYNTLAYISIKYPHTFDLENTSSYRLFVPNSTMASKAYLQIASFNSSVSDTAIFYDLTNHKRIKTRWSPSYLEVLVPNAAGEKECFISANHKIANITSLLPVSTDLSHFAKFNNYGSNAYLNSNYIMITDKKLMAAANDYKNYRETNSQCIPLLLDIDELYDQFSYGVRKNPLAIRNFCRFAISHFNEVPKGLFLIGKSYRAGEDCNDNCSYRHNPTHFNNSLVPGFGNPPSDILFTNNLLPSDILYEPAIPTGRLAAKEPNDVTLYLNKVIQYEDSMQNNHAEWMKNVLHFGGGTSVSQQQAFEIFLNSYKAIIEDTLFGGYVRTFLKSSPDPIQINVSDSLKNIINNGVSLMTFFGHAAGIGFDMSIDIPSEYTNYGKYFFLLANSCLAGDLFSTGISSSEAFVLIANKGAVGYLASTTPSTQNSLHDYSMSFYQNLSYLNYGQPIGKVIQKTIKNNEQPANMANKNVCLNMTLHGDPAVIINSQPKPDYVITPDKVYFNPTEVTSENDSFIVNIISTNIGRAIADSFFVKVVRTFPDNTTQTYLDKVPATMYKDTFSFVMPVDKVKGVGLNHFWVMLDAAPYNIDELLENNNTVYDVPLFIKSYDIIPVYPYKYAIIPSNTVILKASTGDPFAQAKNYIFQLDTTDAFNSPLRMNYMVNHSGGVVPWPIVLPILSKDSVVYYWRVCLDSSYFGGNANWRESSFQHIQGKRGWGQAHFFQFKNDKYEYVSYNKPMRRFDFVNNILSISAQTGYNIPWNDEWWKINGIAQSITSWIPTGMVVADIDSISGLPRDTFYNEQNNPDFEFNTSDTAGRNALKNFLAGIPHGHYVLVYSHLNHYAQDFDEELYKQFDSIGSGNIRNVTNGYYPYALFGQKGKTVGNFPQEQEILGSSSSTPILLNSYITTNWKRGFVESELIGPATKWGSLHWRQHAYNGYQTDSVRLSVLGIKLSGEIDTVISSLPRDSMDILNLSSLINAATYPYLKLIAFMQDDSMHTPPQLDRWQVIYDGVPETALDPSLHFSFYSSELQEGDSIRFSTATHNISEYNMDSLLIKYWIVDKDRNTHLLYYKKQRPHPAGDTLITSITASTKGYSGLNSLWVEVNPDNNQLEQYHFNNIGQVTFLVNTDKINPLLDVTFDAVHILNGDVVSGKPMIQIKLKDENKFLLLNEQSDTSLFKISLKTPSNPIPVRIYFGDLYNMKFFPTQSAVNACRIEYNPVFAEDGTYELYVFAKDKSGNHSGDIDYKISFEVINRSTITEVMNWPNPFSTATHFVFKLTGSELPTYFKIQIMTITGKIVREINLDELGPIHVGRNITEYAWDGKDDFGDRLANGVYLYRVITNINGNSIEKAATSADKYFTKEFGKMYLIR